MSQKSPRSSRSKSPSCHDENEEEENRQRSKVFDDIQRQVEEEIENADKAISVADKLVAEYGSKMSSRQLSRAGSPREPLDSSQPYSTIDPYTQRASLINDEYETTSRPYSNAGSHQHSRATSPFDGRTGYSRRSPVPRTPTYNASRNTSLDRASVLAEKATSPENFTSSSGSPVNNADPTQDMSPTYGIPIVDNPLERLSKRSSRNYSGNQVPFENYARDPSNENSRDINDNVDVRGTSGNISRASYYNGSKIPSGTSYGAASRSSPVRSHLERHRGPSGTSYGAASRSLPVEGSRAPSGVNYSATSRTLPLDFDKPRGPSGTSYGAASKILPAGSVFEEKVMSGSLSQYDEDRRNLPTCSRTENDEVRAPSTVTFDVGTTEPPKQVCIPGTSPAATYTISRSPQNAAVYNEDPNCYFDSSRNYSSSQPTSSIPTSYNMSCSRITPSPYSVATSRDFSPGLSPYYSILPREASFNNPIPSSTPITVPYPNTFISPPSTYGQFTTPSSDPSGMVDQLYEDEQRILLRLSNLSRQNKSSLMNDSRSLPNPCASKQKKTPERNLPRKPELTPEEINQLIRSETEDVESVWHLTSDQRKTYKKPCPKQQKAQMNVKHIVHAEINQPSTNQACVKEYPPMIDPAPEDIPPEVAAAMMFTQERGIKMESCPGETINHFFPDEHKGFADKVLASSISIIDQNQRGKEEMIEKSAGVPSEGVSDSAYTRTMKQKGEEVTSHRSYDLDFALGQDKREYVYLAQKPQRENKFQFRGNLPSWFPGYFSAFPEQSGVIKVVSSPSKLFQKAWALTNPGIFPPNDLIVLE